MERQLPQLEMILFVDNLELKELIDLPDKLEFVEAQDSKAWLSIVNESFRDLPLTLGNVLLNLEYKEYFLKFPEDIWVETAPTMHSMPCSAFRITADNWSIAYCVDHEGILANAKASQGIKRS